MVWIGLEVVAVLVVLVSLVVVSAVLLPTRRASHADSHALRREPQLSRTDGSPTDRRAHAS